MPFGKGNNMKQYFLLLLLSVSYDLLGMDQVTMDILFMDRISMGLRDLENRENLSLLYINDNGNRQKAFHISLNDERDQIYSNATSVRRFCIPPEVFGAVRIKDIKPDALLTLVMAHKGNRLFIVITENNIPRALEGASVNPDFLREENGLLLELELSRARVDEAYVIHHESLNQKVLELHRASASYLELLKAYAPNRAYFTEIEKDYFTAPIK
jgi:hypothetical protein